MKHHINSQVLLFDVAQFFFLFTNSNDYFYSMLQKFLNQVHEDHKQIDLEWLRNAPPQLVT